MVSLFSKKRAAMKISTKNLTSLKIGSREIDLEHPPLVIAEIGINHEGNFDKAIQMIDDAASVGCECVKFQSHIVEDEMIPTDIIPGNANESIWNIIKRCALTEDEENKLKKYTESKGMLFLSTPFSRAAAERLERLGVVAYKIGSGECNNYPLIEHIAKYGKPIILSTGMNNLESITKSVNIFRKYKIPYALLHCTSIYPTPNRMVRLGALLDLKETFPEAVIGLSDHSLTIYPCLGAVAIGARIIERHFTSDKNWSGPDIPISMNPKELKELIEGSCAIFEALGGKKDILKDEQPTINFAYACVVAIRDIVAGERFGIENIWVKRPGTGEIKAEHFYNILNKHSKENIKKDEQIKWSQVDD